MYYIAYSNCNDVNMKWFSVFYIIGIIILWIVMFSVNTETNPPTDIFVKFGFCLIMTLLISILIVIAETDDAYEKIKWK